MDPRSFVALFAQLHLAFGNRRVHGGGFPSQMLPQICPKQCVCDHTTQRNCTMLYRSRTFGHPEVMRNGPKVVRCRVCSTASRFWQRKGTGRSEGVSLHSCCRSHAECNGNVTAQLDKISNYFQGNKIICVNIYMGSTDSVNDQNKTANYNVRVCSINAVIFNNKVWGKWFAPAHIYRNNMQQNTFILSSARFWQAVRAATTGRKCDGIVHFPGTIIQVAFPVRICGSFPFPMATYSSAGLVQKTRICSSVNRA